MKNLKSGFIVASLVLLFFTYQNCSELKPNSVFTSEDAGTENLGSETGNTETGNTGGTGETGETGGTGTGSLGIASAYPLDANIEDSGDVIFAENFESGTITDATDRWSSRRNASGMSLVSDSPAASGGSKALQMTRLGGANEGGALRMWLSDLDEDDNNQLFLRYYIKLDNFSDNADGKSGTYHHTGGGLAGRNHNCNWSWGRAGIRPIGGYFTPDCPTASEVEEADKNGDRLILDNRFSTRFEMNTNGRMDFYNYWMGMHKNKTTTGYYGNKFVGDYSLTYTRQKWVAIEYMLKLNSPATASNGEIKLWVDGKLIIHLKQCSPDGGWLHGSFYPEDSSGYADNKKYTAMEAIAPFEGFQWRSDSRLKMNVMSLAYYVTKDTKGNARIWYDNVVLAKKYIGLIEPK